MYLSVHKCYISTHPPNGGDVFRKYIDLINKKSYIKLYFTRSVDVLDKYFYTVYSVSL